MWILAASVTACTSGGVAPGRTAEIAARIATYREAGVRRDVAALEGMYDAAYFHTNPDGSIMTREQVLASYRAPATMSLLALDGDEQTIIARGGFAAASERVVLSATSPKGQPFVSRYRVTYVWEKQEGTWRLLTSHSSFLGIDSTGRMPRQPRTDRDTS